MTFEPNTLYYGDNLDIVRKYISDESIDLIYLDPPFNSKADYNILFKEKSGKSSVAQIQAFSDFWHWDHTAENTYLEIQEDPNLNGMIRFLHAHLGRNDMMAYLVMMTIRLRELHRVLKLTGSLYIHCDPTASHYLKIVMDSIFRPNNFKNEIIWRRTGAHGTKRSFAPIHDTLLFYTKTSDYYFQVVKKPYMKGHVETRYSKDDLGRYKFTSGGNILTGAGATGGESGQVWRGFDPSAKNRHWAIPKYLAKQMPPEFEKLGTLEKLEQLYQKGLIEIKKGSAWATPVRYLSQDDGQQLPDIWAAQPYTERTVFGTDEVIDADVAWLGTTDPERLGFQTQKPLGLLERVIKSSCPPDGIVLDPFCGCGTTIIAAQKLKRKWVGIDITHLAISLIKSRLRDMKVIAKRDYTVIGEPVDFASAKQLAETNPFQFQWWALSLIENAKPTSPKKKKGADKGVDGWLTFREGERLTLKRIVIQVKGGVHIGAKDIRDLIGTVENTKSTMGIFVTLHEPTKPMIQAAFEANHYTSPTWGHKYPKIQILTIKELLEGKKPEIPHAQLV